MNEKLTTRQRQILNFISECIEQRGYSPSLREIADHFDIVSTNAVNDHLLALQRKGYLSRDFKKSRSLRPVGRSNSVAEVPLINSHLDGKKNFSLVEAERKIRLDQFLLGQEGETWAVHYDGAIEENEDLNPGDILFVQKNLSAVPGDLLAVLFKQEICFVRYLPERERARASESGRRSGEAGKSTTLSSSIRQQGLRTGEILGVVVGFYRPLRRT